MYEHRMIDQTNMNKIADTVVTIVKTVTTLGIK